VPLDAWSVFAGGNLSSTNDWFSVQVALEGLSYLGCPDVRRYEGEPLAQEIGLVGTPDLVAGPLKGGVCPEDFYIDVARPSGAHFIKPQARVPAGVFLEQLEKSYLRTVERKIAKYAASRRSIMFGMVWGFSEVGGKITDEQRKAAHEAGLVLAAIIGLDQTPDPEKSFAELESMLTGGNDLLVRVAPLSLDLAFFLWAIKRENDGFASFLAVNARIGSEAPQSHSVIQWLRQCSAFAASGGRVRPPPPSFGAK